MKKIVALVLAAILVLGCCSFATAEVPEGYPEIIEGLDFGGRTVYIYDWWSSGERSKEPTPEEELTYAYRDWLEETYNVKIVEKALSDWAGNPAELSNRVQNADDSELCIIAVAGDFAGAAFKNNLYMPWTIDLSAAKWNKSVKDFATKNGQVYGVNVGKNEPRNVIYFDVPVLEAIGITADDMYDLQANKEWTWDKMVEIMTKVQRDTDNDGENDVFGITGSNDDLLMGLIFSNDGSIFDTDENGKLFVSAGSDNTLEAIAERAEILNNFAAPQPEGSNWDWFKEFWKTGKTAFYAGQTWQGLNDGNEMTGMEDEYGILMFPMGPRAENYRAYVNNNVYGIPNVYDDATSLMIQQIYDLYTNDTPGVNAEEDESWVGNKLNFTDERAIYETYAMMREDDVSAANKVFLLGGINQILGEQVKWMWNYVYNKTPAESVETAKHVWDVMCGVFNGDIDESAIDAAIQAQDEADAAEAEAAAEAAAEAEAEGAGE